MRLIDLNPQWVCHGGEGVSDGHGNPIPLRERVGLSFDCPCGCGTRLPILFTNPPDGPGPVVGIGNTWERTGEDFETMTLSPSILRREPCPARWHGFVTNGEILTC